jgi:hypothetical protein
MLDTRNTFCGAPKESSSKVALIYLLNGLLDRSMERLSHIGLQDIFGPNRFVLVACHDAHICGYRPHTVKTNLNPVHGTAHGHIGLQDIVLTGSQKCIACIQLTRKFEIMLDTRNYNCGAPKESY